MLRLLSDGGPAGNFARSVVRERALEWRVRKVRGLLIGYRVGCSRGFDCILERLHIERGI